MYPLKTYLTILSSGAGQISCNGFGLDAGREIEAQKFNLPQLPNSIPKVEDSTEALLAFKPLLVAVNIGISNLSELKPKVVEEAN